MKTYKVTEIFRSIQGEGPSIGYPAIFVRFAGCTVGCSFCDTDYTEREILTKNEILSRIGYLNASGKTEVMRVILTGGEPLMQIDTDLIESLKDIGLTVCMETSGIGNNADIEALKLCDEIVLSPKNFSRTNMRVVAQAHCLKVLAPDIFTHNELDILVDTMGIMGKQLVLQPITPPDGLNELEMWIANFNEAMSVLEYRQKTRNEDWRIIPQTHVVFGVK